MSRIRRDGLIFHPGEISALAETYILYKHRHKLAQNWATTLDKRWTKVELQQQQQQGQMDGVFDWFTSNMKNVQKNVLYRYDSMNWVSLDLHVDGTADDLWALPSLPQGYCQVLCTVGFQQRHFGWRLLRVLLPGHGQIHSRTLGLGLEQLLKSLNIQVL